jgi:glycosyltransferase involved in cell wall biosynthesis
MLKKTKSINQAFRPKILQVITRAERGGAQTHVLTLAESLRHVCEVVVATGEHGFLTVACEQSGIPVHVVPHMRRAVNPFVDALALRELRSLMQLVKPHLVHVHTFKAGFLGRLAAKGARIPSVYTLHSWVPAAAGMSPLWKTVAGPCERWAGKWCDRVITVSTEGARLASSEGLGSHEKIAVIPNGIPDCAERASLVERESPIIIMVARFMEPKDHLTLLRAFASLPGNPRLWLVGDGPRRAESQALAKRLNIHHRVEFLGDRDDVPALLAASDIFVLSSASEMLPISVLEAMRAGLPVIASDVGGMRELIIDGVSGVLVAPGSAKLLTEALRPVIADVVLRRKLGCAARQRFTEHFAASRQRDLVLALYREVLSKSGMMMPAIDYGEPYPVAA